MANKVIDLSPTFPMRSMAEEVIITDPNDNKVGQIFGGLFAGSRELSHGKIRIQGVDERILFGDATSPTDGIGIFMGKNGDDNYEFRVGNPAGSNIHWDGSTLSIVGFLEVGQAANDVNSGVVKISASKIEIDGSTTFSAGYDPSAKVDELGGSYNSAASGARVRIFPDSNTGIQAVDNSGNDVFKVIVGGTDVGDVIIGDFAGSKGLKWDKSTTTFEVRGKVVTSSGSDLGASYLTGDVAEARITANVLNALQTRLSNLGTNYLSAISADFGTMTAGSITGITITGGTIRTASSGQRVEILGSDNSIKFYDSSNNFCGRLEGLSNAFVITAGNAPNIRITDPLSIEAQMDLQSNIHMNNFKVTEAGSVGLDDNKRIQFDQSGRIQVTDDFDPSTGSDYALGGSTRYWTDVHCENVVDHSMGFYDDGFVDKNGKKISDVQAILNMRPHPTRKMPNGRPFIDKRSLPEEFIVKAVHKTTGVLFDRDEDDRPYYIKGGVRVYVDDYDGSKSIQVLALALGAIKELNAEIKALELLVKAKDRN